ncbi:MAG TPA: Mur ligase family protein [Acidobacteriota bacterium]
MRFAEAEEYLKNTQGENCKLSLANIQRIIDRAPFDGGAVKYVQVAGTNGKGSTAHFIAAILRSAGLRVGLFTSPHLQDVAERIQVDGRPISRRDFALAVGAVRDLAADLLAGKSIANPPTFFETLFLASLFHFAARRVDWAVLEVGLGGRLDATSTVRPEITVITNISLDHTNILGKTLAAIAREKAGIIRRGVPLVSGCPPRSTGARVIRAAARATGAPLTEVFAPGRRLAVEKKRSGYACRYLGGGPLGGDLQGREYRFLVTQKGRHQTLNAAVAVAAIDVLKARGLEIPDAAVARGIASMFIPARIEAFGGRPPLILDGGHNNAGIKALVDYLREENIRGFTLLFGVLRDKQYPAMARRLAPLAAHVVLSEPVSERALPAEKLLPFFPKNKCLIERDYARALTVAKKFKRTIIVCGSLYLVGGMRTIVLERRKTWTPKNSGRSKSFIET